MLNLNELARERHARGRGVRVVERDRNETQHETAPAITPRSAWETQWNTGKVQGMDGIESVDGCSLVPTRKQWPAMRNEDVVNDNIDINAQFFDECWETDVQTLNIKVKSDETIMKSVMAATETAVLVNPSAMRPDPHPSMSPPKLRMEAFGVKMAPHHHTLLEVEESDNPKGRYAAVPWWEKHPQQSFPTTYDDHELASLNLGTLIWQGNWTILSKIVRKEIQNAAVQENLVASLRGYGTRKMSGLLYLACERHAPVDLVRDMIDRATMDGFEPINRVTEEGKTMLHVCMIRKHLNGDLIRMLIDKGVDVHARDDIEWTALRYAVSYDNSLDILKVLIQVGADPQTRNNLGQTMLDVAHAQHYHDMKGIADLQVQACKPQKSAKFLA